MPALSPNNEPLKTSPQYSLPHSRTCCLLLSNSLNRRSLAISARSPFICHTPCGTRWRNLSTLVASYSIHIPYRPCLHCAPRRYPTVQLSSHVSCSCLGLMRWDCRNGSEAMHSLRSTAKSEIIVVKPGHQNKMNAGTWSARPGQRVGRCFLIDRVAAVFGLDGCFILECSPQADISHQCRRRVSDQLSGGTTVASTGRPR